MIKQLPWIVNIAENFSHTGYWICHGEEKRDPRFLITPAFPWQSERGVSDWRRQTKSPQSPVPGKRWSQPAVQQCPWNQPPPPAPPLPPPLPCPRPPSALAAAALFFYPRADLVIMSHVIKQMRQCCSLASPRAEMLNLVYKPCFGSPSFPLLILCQLHLGLWLMFPFRRWAKPYFS